MVVSSSRWDEAQTHWKVRRCRNFDQESCRQHVFGPVSKFLAKDFSLTLSSFVALRRIFAGDVVLSSKAESKLRALCKTLPVSIFSSGGISADGLSSFWVEKGTLTSAGAKASNASLANSASSSFLTAGVPEVIS